MRRRVHLGLIVAAIVSALALGGCGGSVTTSSTAGTSTSVSTSTSRARSGDASTTQTTRQSTPSGTANVPLQVSPSSGSPSSTIHFSFKAPASSGRQGAERSSYTLSVAGPRDAECVATHDTALSARRRGERVAVSIGPSQLGGRWCVGAYVARVDELSRPVCAAGQMCPQFVRLVEVAGPTRFRIKP